ncbi:hypothetical protein ABW19_dt0202845 [Dactylella cylindrospora]|nr:hypothetical protein ABW19_dt0202845 [Dactylella cylindrospora]
MEFYIPEIPAPATRKQIEGALAEVFRKYYIYAWDFWFWTARGKNYQSAKFIIHDERIGQDILRDYEQPPSRRITRGGRTFITHPNPPKIILITGKKVSLLKSNSREPVSSEHIRALRAENERKAHQLANRQTVQKKPYRTPVSFHGFECGVWTTDPRRPDLPTFSSFYSNGERGNFRIRKSAVQVHISQTDRYIIVPSNAIRSEIITRDGRGTWFLITTSWCPKFYRRTQETAIFPDGRRRSKESKSRLSSLDERHKKIAAYCFVYRFRLQDERDALRINTIGGLSGFVEVSDVEAYYDQPIYDFQVSMNGLDRQLENLPFPIAFQLQSLAYNGILLPHRVKELLGVVRTAYRTHGQDETAAVLKFWVDSWRPQIHSDDPEIWLSQSIIKEFNEMLKKRLQSASYNLQMKLLLKDNQVLVHRVCIYPTGIHLFGPSFEPKNRVLRRYEKNLNNFIRVTLMDEGSRDLGFERNVDATHIYSERFLPFFTSNTQGLRIGGHNFTFLGFSQSSLRSHAAWFMSPFIDYQSPGRPLMTVASVIKDLGDFGDIRIPGKCAARIGQAFTDTVANIKIEASMVTYVKDIERTVGNRTYTFSDGCGTISPRLLRGIWEKGNFGPDSVGPGRPSPTIFQIRFGGSKGVVSLDSRMAECQIRLRSSMKKFEATKHSTFEICMSVTKPLDFYLNRPLIKILEDRGVPKASFMQVQKELLDRLRAATQAPDSTAYFLEREGRCKHAELPFLIRELGTLGWNYQEDHFLRQVVEFSMMSSLREMKYRARIRVKKGYTLIGILDETGYLQEGEIYCPIKEDGKRRWAPKGLVAIARSPALHPGDIQVVTAIEHPPRGSPLLDLTNCVVFSRHGPRDLPNMLAGGDLDGDLYHVWWDPRLMPRKHAYPADYDSVQATALDRPVNQDDIGKFFVDFMENDKLGAISIAHLVLADQKPNGVFSEECLKCAALASTAVDFPKTGIPVRSVALKSRSRKILDGACN